MPWKETCAMDQRVECLGDWLSGEYTKMQLSRIYGVSRPTIDKWIARYEHEGPAGLAERSRGRHTQAHAVSPELAQRIVEAKEQRQHWGPKKLMDRLRRLEPEVAWPADSTAGEILKRAGWVRPRRRRRRVAPREGALAHCQHCHQVWSTDFKGDYRLGNGQRCYPLTISDNHNRYLLACRALARPTGAAVQPWFEWVFREHGLPERIRSDNGAPFASLALGGLSALAAWWVRLGIRPERITPGTPSENGRHERMHRTLKADAIEPPCFDLQAQQQRFDRFVEEYNHERSHESLKRRTPGENYVASPRPYPDKIPPVTYDTGTSVRRVRHNGEIKWNGHLVYVSGVLASEPVGLEPIETGLWEVRYSFHRLGILDERRMTIAPGQGLQKAGNL